MGSTADDQVNLRADTTEEYLDNATFVANRFPPGNPEGYNFTLFPNQKRILLIRTSTPWTKPPA